MISLPTSDTFTSHGVDWAAMLVVIVLAVIGAILIPRITVALLSRRLRGRRSGDIDVHARAKRADTLVAVVRSLSRYAAIIVGILAIFIFGFPSAGASVLGISLLIAIVGFAAQSVLRDIIAGIRADGNAIDLGVRLSLFDMVPFRPDPALSQPGKLGPASRRTSPPACPTATPSA